MQGYLYTAGGTYLLAEATGAAAPVSARSAQAAPAGLITITNYDPVTRGPAADPVIRSQGQVTLHSDSGVLIAPRQGPAGLLLTCDPAAGAPQIGYDVLRIFKVGAERGEPIHPGDTIVLRFTPPGEPPVQTWLSASAAEVVLRPGAQPHPADYLTLLKPVDLADFSVLYDDLLDEVVGEASLTGPALPGGLLLTVDSPDAPDLLPHGSLLLEDMVTRFAIGLNEGFADLTPCSPRTITVRAGLPLTGEVIEEPLKLEGDRAYFLKLKVISAQRVRSSLPLGGVTVNVTAELSLDPLERRIDPVKLRLPVILLSESPAIQNLAQKAEHLLFDTPLQFTFTVQPPPEDEPPVCALLVAHFQIEGKMREARFAAKISARGILLDPPG